MSKKQIVIIVALLILIALITACTVGPDYERPQFFDDTQIEKSLDLKPVTPKSAAAFSPLDFEDTTLNELMVQALNESPTIRLALVRLRH